MSIPMRMGDRIMAKGSRLKGSSNPRDESVSKKGSEKMDRMRDIFVLKKSRDSCQCPPFIPEKSFSHVTLETSRP